MVQSPRIRHQSKLTGKAWENTVQELGKVGLTWIGIRVLPLKNVGHLMQVTQWSVGQQDKDLEHSCHDTTVAEYTVSANPNKDNKSTTDGVIRVVREAQGSTGPEQQALPSAGR